MKKIISLSFIVGLLLVSVTSYADMKMDNFRVILAPAVAKNTAAYGVINNTGDESDTLIDVSSDVATVILHKTEINSGKAKMIHMANMVIEPDEVLVLEPLSFHLMLSSMKTDMFNKGATITLYFEFERAGVLEVKAVVVPAWE